MIKENLYRGLLPIGDLMLVIGACKCILAIVNGLASFFPCSFSLFLSSANLLKGYSSDVWLLCRTFLLNFEIFNF